MAVPLPATEQPLEAPFDAPVLAEAQLLFDLAGVDPLPPVEDVITVDFYLSGQVTNEYSFYSLGEPLPPEETLPNEGGTGNPTTECDPAMPSFMGSYFQPVTPKETKSFFPIIGEPLHPCPVWDGPGGGEVFYPALTSLFEWIDVASFYWFESPYPILDEIEPVTPPEPPPPPDPFFQDSWRPSFLFDFFLGRYRSLGCDPIDLEVVAPIALELEGFAPDVAVTENVLVRPLVAPLAVEGFAPTLVMTENVRLAPAQAALAVEGFAPSVFASDLVGVQPASAVLAVEGFAPIVGLSDNVMLEPASAELTLAGPAPFTGTLPPNAMTADGVPVTANSVIVTATGGP
jgi:hypothetical protein